ncbi:MAG: ribosome maturation factor RimM [Proteobacteria bacterium]|nr:16S rRNA processing protein RimM [Luminiphilus sp.]MBL6821054.1 16S rRNA processing protein RimM [Luminiphilus sp.]MDA0650269.1 ribosome maturation factor RimM [Pseudomonadota bacterium]
MQHTSPSEHESLTIADIVGVYGIKGWVKLRVRLDEPDLLFSLPSLQLRYPVQLARRAPESVTIEKLQRHGKGYIAQLAGVIDRTTAETLRGAEICVPKGDFPAAGDDEVYWRDLEGLSVFCTEAGSRCLLGTVKTLLETGANDVLVVSPCEGSVDDKEHLVPWIPQTVITEVNLEARSLEVAWYVDD